MFFKIGVLKISQYSPENTFVGVSFSLIKKILPTQLLSCKYCEIYENSFFYRTFPVTASEGLRHGFLTGNFTDSGKLYQQL